MDRPIKEIIREMDEWSKYCDSLEEVANNLKAVLEKARYRVEISLDDPEGALFKVWCTLAGSKPEMDPDYVFGLYVEYDHIMIRVDSVYGKPSVFPYDQPACRTAGSVWLALWAVIKENT